MKLSVVFSEQDLNVLSQLLIERAEKIISNPVDEEKFYVSGCQAFLYFMKRDSGRMQKRVPVVLNSVLSKLRSYSTWNYDAFVYNRLLGYLDYRYGKTHMSPYTEQRLFRLSILKCLTTKNIFFMWYGSEYHQNLGERLDYLKRGLYSKAPVGFEEIGLPYSYYSVPSIDFVCNNLNDLMPYIYSSKLLGYDVKDALILKKHNLLFDYILVNNSGKSSERYGVYTYAYPLNLFVDMLSTKYGYTVYKECPMIISVYHDYLLSLMNSILNRLLYVNKYYYELLELRFKDNLSDTLIGRYYNIAGHIVNSDMRKALSLVKGYLSAIPTSLTPWCSILKYSSYSFRGISNIPLRPISAVNWDVILNDLLGEPVKHSDSIQFKKLEEPIPVFQKPRSIRDLKPKKVQGPEVIRAKITFPNENVVYTGGNPFANIYLYGEHLKVGGELSEAIRNAYVENFLASAEKSGVDVDFLSNNFHNAYYSLFSDSVLSDNNLTYADCKLLEQFMGCSKETFSEILSKQLGCNYQNFEGLTFGLISLLLRSNIIDKSYISRWVFCADEIALNSEQILLTDSLYYRIPNCSKDNSKFVVSLDKILRDNYGKLLYNPTLWTSLTIDRTSTAIISAVLNNICSKLKLLGFYSLNAVGFYLMNGRERYFHTFSPIELKFLKKALRCIGCIKSINNTTPNSSI